MDEATPATKSRLGFAILANEGLLLPGIAESDPRLVHLTTREAGKIVTLVNELKARSRAPLLKDFDDEGSVRDGPPVRRAQPRPRHWCAFTG